VRICILECDTLDRRMAPDLDRFADFFVRLFESADAVGWTFDPFDVQAGEYPASFALYDAVLITGSAADAFSSEPWVATLRSKVKDLLASQQKLIGVCFGHQLIAYCLGAPVARAPAGWTIGRGAYHWPGVDAVASGNRSDLALLAVHQDQVLALPQGARLLASSPTCPVAAFAVGDRVLAIQPHPEFDATFVRALVDHWRGKLDPKLLDAALENLDQPNDSATIGHLMTDFIRGQATSSHAQPVSRREDTRA